MRNQARCMSQGDNEGPLHLHFLVGSVAHIAGSPRASVAAVTVFTAERHARVASNRLLSAALTTAWTGIG